MNAATTPEGRWGDLTRHDLDSLTAEEVIVRADGGRSIFILDEEAATVEHVLDRDRAIVFAQRLLTLARNMPEPRTLRRPASVDEELRERDG